MNKIEITSDNRLRFTEWLRRVEIQIVGGCNLRCANCAHISPWRKYITPLAEVKETIDLIVKRFALNWFSIVGGETFLHPDIFAIMEYACERFPSVNIATNGTMILKHRMRDELIELTRRYPGFLLSVSVHPPVEITETLDWLSENKVRHQVDRRETFGKTVYGVSIPNLEFVPENDCYASRCHTVIGKQLFRCSKQASRYSLITQGLRNNEPINSSYVVAVLDGSSIDLENSSVECIRDYLLKHPTYECFMCHKDRVSEKQHQLSWDEYKKVYKTIENS
jgi:hypothetical protein